MRKKLNIQNTFISECNKERKKQVTLKIEKLINSRLIRSLQEGR